MQITDFDREWVMAIAGRPVTDQEIQEFKQDLDNYLTTIDDNPEFYRDQDHWQ